MKHDYTSWAEIDLKAIRANFRAIKRLTRERIVEQRVADGADSANVRNPGVLAVVKADAYGHGMLHVVDEISKIGLDFLGVSELREGVILRQNGVEKPILIFEPPFPSSAKQVIDYGLIPTVCTFSMASALNTYAKSLNKKAPVHIKIDTGMGRLGIWHTEAVDFIKRVMRLSHLVVEGVYTHFPLADTNADFTLQQVEELYDVIKHLDEDGNIVPYVHGANSLGLGGYSTRIFNLVRPGLMLYGLYPAPQAKDVISLKPAMSVKARVTFVKDIEKGRGVSYGHSFVADRAMRVATLPIGYNDGYMRILSNKSCVLIDGKRCPVLGNVTMDQLMVDVSKAKKVRIGSEAVILGSQGQATITAEELADYAQTINYEIVCAFGNRLPRVYKS